MAVREWLQIATNEVPNPIAVLVGINKGEERREVTTKEGQELGQELGNTALKHLFEKAFHFLKRLERQEKMYRKHLQLL